MAKAAAHTTRERITRDDLEQGFSNLQGGIKGKVEDRKQAVFTVLGVVAVAALLVVFLLGKRSGKKKTTLVEIRRI